MKRVLAFALVLGLYAPAGAQTNPCDDPVYLRLQEIDLDDMSEREFEVFSAKTKACTDFLVAHGRRADQQEGAPFDSSAVQRFSTRGFSLRAHFNATSWWLDDHRFFDDTHRGGGAGLGVSYGVSELVTIMLNLDGAAMGSGFGSDFGMGFADLGVRFTFASDKKKLRPFAEVALTGFGAERDVHVDFRRDGLPGKVSTGGGGLTLGGGLLYFFSPPLALDIGLDFTFGEMTQVTYRSVSIDSNTNSAASRLMVGIAWYPGH